MLSMFNNKIYSHVHTYNHGRFPAVIFLIAVTNASNLGSRFAKRVGSNEKCNLPKNFGTKSFKDPCSTFRRQLLFSIERIVQAIVR